MAGSCVGKARTYRSQTPRGVTPQCVSRKTRWKPTSDYHRQALHVALGVISASSYAHVREGWDAEVMRQMEAARAAWECQPLGRALGHREMRDRTGQNPPPVPRRID
jgi:hypothetical protein